MTRPDPLTRPSARVALDVTGRGSYSTLIALVAPRPIAWVATRSAAGVDNLAPHSFFTIVSGAPLVIAVVSRGEKDTLRNVRATGELVVCGVPARLRDAANLTGAEFPPDISEFDAAGLTREPAQTVAVSRVAQSPYAIECRLRQTVEVGDGTMILGDVTFIAVDEAALVDGRVSTAALDLVSRAGANDWFELGTRHPTPRVRYADVAEPEAR